MFLEKQAKIEKRKEKRLQVGWGSWGIVWEVENRRRNAMMIKYIIDYYGIITRRKIDWKVQPREESNHEEQVNNSNSDQRYHLSHYDLCYVLLLMGLGVFDI